MQKLLSKRFTELSADCSAVEKTLRTFTHEIFGGQEQLDANAILAWKINARTLLNAACGADSNHMHEFIEAEKYVGQRSDLHAFRRLKTVFEATKNDYEGGYLASVAELVRAEVFESELEQARELHKSGYITAAAVVAGVVLETTLRTLCTANSITPVPRSLDGMNSALVKAQVYGGLVSKQVVAIAHLRNQAAHGNTSEFDAVQVDKMIDNVEHFIFAYGK